MRFVGKMGECGNELYEARNGLWLVTVACDVTRVAEVTDDDRERNRRRMGSVTDVCF